MTAIQVRPETLQAWDAIKSEGETPSVRKVYEIVGGAYNTVVSECQLLRERASNSAQLDDPASIEQRIAELEARISALEAERDQLHALLHAIGNNDFSRRRLLAWASTMQPNRLKGLVTDLIKHLFGGE